MDELIVADTNVLILLFRTDILPKLFSKYSVIIPPEIYKELTEYPPHRTPQEYPDLTKFVKEAVFNPQFMCKIEVVDISDLSAMEAYYQLESVDEGERQGIGLAIEKDCPFVSRDSSALQDFIDLGSVRGSPIFCDQLIVQLEKLGVIQKADVEKYNNLTHS